MVIWKCEIIKRKKGPLYPLHVVFSITCNKLVDLLIIINKNLSRNVSENVL